MKQTDDFSELPPECDVLCEWRRCLHRGYNKGSYTPGRGYTSYYAKPIYVCLYRMQHGCPQPRPTPDLQTMITDLQAKTHSLKMTKKVRAEISRLYKIIRLLSENLC